MMKLFPLFTHTLKKQKIMIANESASNQSINQSAGGIISYHTHTVYHSLSSTPLLNICDGYLYTLTIQIQKM